MTPQPKRRGQDRKGAGVGQDSRRKDAQKKGLTQRAETLNQLVVKKRADGFDRPITHAERHDSEAVSESRCV